MALTFISLIESGTFYAINNGVGIQLIPQAPISITKPIHQHYNTSYLPLIPTAT